MDITWKRAGNYRAMARKGVTCATLKQDHRFGQYTWEIKCWKDSEMKKDDAKSAVREYLEQEFDAVGITFFQHHKDGPNCFWARFRSYAL